MIGIVDVVRRARLRALLRHQLTNGDDVWQSHLAGEAVPPLRFRNGLTLAHGASDAPVFLFFEIFANACYRRLLVPPARGETVVDVGANIGAFTLDCAMRFGSVRIDAYEPNPVAFGHLQANVEANHLTDRVRVYPEAVGRCPGVLTLWRGSGSLVATAYPDAAEAAGSASQCAMVDLETVIARAGGAAGVIKIDAEGAEADILEGGSAVLRSAAQVVGEYHADRVPDVVDRCRVVLEREGFAFTAGRTRRCGSLFQARRIE